MRKRREVNDATRVSMRPTSRPRMSSRRKSPDFFRSFSRFQLKDGKAGYKVYVSECCQ